jgi:allantoicase
VISTVERGFPLATIVAANGARLVDSSASGSSSSDTKPVPGIDVGFNGDDAWNFLRRLKAAKDWYLEEYKKSSWLEEALRAT